MNASAELHEKLLNRFRGVILGTALGDALGLPAEGLSAEQIRRRWKGKWKMRFAFGRGMVSDDTEHTIMVAQCLVRHPTDAWSFQRAFAWKLRWWFLALPAGVGFATARACLKLLCGASPTWSGVRSAGNGPAMRAAVIGAFFANDVASRREFVRAATCLTHTDKRAEFAAQAVAEAAAWAFRGEDAAEFLTVLPRIGEGEEWQSLCQKLANAYNSQVSVTEFAASLGLERGVSGYALHTLPVSLYAWLRHPNDFRSAVTTALDCGGDTDTVGAIVGAIVGTHVGKAGIPAEWLDRVKEWPRSIGWMERLAAQLAAASSTKRALKPIRYFWPAVLIRNIWFLCIVLAHGFRRLVPSKPS